MTATPRLAPETYAVWRAIVAHFDAHGFAPTVRELMALCGYSSTSGVFYQLHKLEAAGVITRLHGTGSGRALALKRKPAKALNLDEQAAIWLERGCLLRWHGNPRTGVYTGFCAFELPSERLMAKVGEVSHD